MISPQEWHDYGQSIVNKITELEELIEVTEEEQLSKILQNTKKFPVLVFVDLSANSLGQSLDSYRDVNSALVFVLSKTLNPNSSLQKIFADKILHHTIIEKIDMMIKSNTDGAGKPCHFLRNLNINSVHKDPVYNYVGCNGYSMSFEF